MGKKKSVQEVPEKSTQKNELLDMEELRDNQIRIEGLGVITIKPTKLKYFVVKNSINKEKTSMADYDGAKLIQEMGVSDVLHYSDGVEIVENLIKAILDIDKVDFFESLTTKDINKMIEIANNVNEIKSEDFVQENLNKEMVNPQKVESQ